MMFIELKFGSLGVSIKLRLGHKEKIKCNSPAAFLRMQNETKSLFSSKKVFKEFCLLVWHMQSKNILIRYLKFYD